MVFLFKDYHKNWTAYILRRRPLYGKGSVMANLIGLSRSTQTAHSMLHTVRNIKSHSGNRPAWGQARLGSSDINLNAFLVFQA